MIKYIGKRIFQMETIGKQDIPSGNTDIPYISKNIPEWYPLENKIFQVENPTFQIETPAFHKFPRIFRMRKNWKTNHWKK